MSLRCKELSAHSVVFALSFMVSGMWSPTHLPCSPVIPVNISEEYIFEL